MVWVLTIIRTLHAVPKFDLSKAPANSVPRPEWVRKIHWNPSQWDAGEDTWQPVIRAKKCWADFASGILEDWPDTGLLALDSFDDLLKGRMFPTAMELHPPCSWA